MAVEQVLCPMGRMSRFLPRCCLAAFLLEISLGDSLLGTQQEELVGLIVSFIGCGMGRNKQAEVFLSSKKAFLGRREGKCFYLRSVALVLFSCFLYPLPCSHSAGDAGPVPGSCMVDTGGNLPSHCSAILCFDSDAKCLGVQEPRVHCQYIT